VRHASGQPVEPIKTAALSTGEREALVRGLVHAMARAAARQAFTAASAVAGKCPASKSDQESSCW
jgi:hypothetical protein